MAPPIASTSIASQPIAAGVSLSASGESPFIVSSTGFFWPGIFPQAGRALSLGMGNSSGILVLGALGQTTGVAGSGSPSVALLASGVGGWLVGPTLPGTPAPMPIAEALEGQPQTQGYALDAYDGLLPWNGSAPVFSTGGSPWLDLAINATGLYLANPSGVYTSGGQAVAGLASTGLIQILGSGGWIYGVSPGQVFAWELSSSTSGNLSASASLPFTATCMGLWPQVSGLALGGTTIYATGNQAYAIAMAGGAYSSNTFTAFVASGEAQAWVLSGAPATWNLLHTSTGLAYSSDLAVAFTPAGNTILGADAGSGRWNAWSYTGGTVALVASGSITGITSFIATESTSTWGLIPQPGASGFYAIFATGATWQASGTVIAGTPLASAVQIISGSTWGVTYSGAVGLVTVLSGTWTLSPLVTGLGWNPTTLAWDPSAQVLWAAGPSGEAWAGRYPAGATAFSTLATGTWGAGASGIVGALATQGQLLLVTSGASELYTAGILSAGVISSGASSVSQPGIPTSLAGPFLDGSILVGATGQVWAWEFAAPYKLTAIPQGYCAPYTTGAGVGSAQFLGYRNIPTAIGLGASGEPWISTVLGYLGPVSGAPGTLMSSLASGGYVFAPGGYTNSVSVSGLTILTTTVQGAILITSAV